METVLNAKFEYFVLTAETESWLGISLLKISQYFDLRECNDGTFILVNVFCFELFYKLFNFSHWAIGVWDFESFQQYQP